MKSVRQARLVRMYLLNVWWSKKRRPYTFVFTCSVFSCLVTYDTVDNIINENIFLKKINKCNAAYQNDYDRSSVKLWLPGIKASSWKSRKKTIIIVIRVNHTYEIIEYINTHFGANCKLCFTTVQMSYHYFGANYKHYFRLPAAVVQITCLYFAENYHKLSFT